MPYGHIFETLDLPREADRLGPKNMSRGTDTVELSGNAGEVAKRKAKRCCWLGPKENGVHVYQAPAVRRLPPDAWQRKQHASVLVGGRALQERPEHD